VDEIAGMPLVKFRLFLQQHGIDMDVFLAESPYQQELISRRRAADVEGTRLHDRQGMLAGSVVR
jgi:hypothetical protein